ncbi:SDR family NAD(P)-dependent oxidoreductase [Brachybacterium tyrofermentans]|uniref:SDR family NAD(P)-dependent oxidoreductase n=1 Tax=Brachybacterium tyrofermentans TaxID=47848 RepID=UPI000A1A9460|nr:Short-chain dehydrogenase/reductase SDR [Corynebacterium xerosis]
MTPHEGRTYVVTGADSGIGALTASTLRRHGARVIRCGLGPDVDVRADLGDDEGRDLLVAEVSRLAPGGIDGLALVAGVGTSTTETVRVNYFGTLAVLAGLRASLRKKPSPRVVVVSSAASLSAGDDDVIGACLRGEEESAIAAAERLIATGRGGVLYRCSKIALNRWVRQSAAGEDWAGTGVVLNVIAPGIVETDSAGTTLSTDSPPDPARSSAQSSVQDSARDRVLSTALPQPLGFPGPVQAIADAISWMISEENSFMAGQIVFVDGGADATLRSDKPYADGVRYGPVATSRMLFWALKARMGPWRRS